MSPEHTDEQADDSSPSPVTVNEDLRPHVTFDLQDSDHWHDADVAINKITVLRGIKPKYINDISERLSRKRLVTDTDAVGVGAFGFCVPFANESPSSAG
jgi:hypothetical protein